MVAENFRQPKTRLLLEGRVEEEFVQQPGSPLLFRRCCMCQSVEIGEEIFPQGRYKEILDDLAREYIPILPGRYLLLHPPRIIFTDTLLSKECLAKQMVGQPRYYQKDGFTLLGRYSSEDVQKMKAYQAIPREKCSS